MTLVVKVQVGERTLHMMTASRVKGNDEPNSLNTYQCRLFTQLPRRATMQVVWEGVIRHRYGDGPLKLTAKLTKLAAEHELKI